MLREDRTCKAAALGHRRAPPQGLKLSDAYKARIVADLNAGKAAVGVLARINEAPAVQQQLTGLGGATSGHDVVDEAALQAATTEPAQ